MSPATKTPKAAELFGVISSNPSASVAEKELAMNLAERLVAAYRTVESAAPSLTVGNDPASGFSILIHAATNCMCKLNPVAARALLTRCLKQAEDELANRPLLQSTETR